MHPQTFNLASRADVTANATCGETENGPETYCKFGGSAGGPQPCGVCDGRSGDPAKAHGPSAAVDDVSAGTWWQSPSLQNGDQYHYVTFGIDLKKVGTDRPLTVAVVAVVMSITRHTTVNASVLNSGFPPPGEGGSGEFGLTGKS